MTTNHTRKIAPAFLLCLLANAAVAADKPTAEEGPRAARVTTELAATATDAATREAVEAVRVVTRLDLDIRFRSRTSLASADAG